MHASHTILRLFGAALAALLALATPALACTAAVILGSATIDGRPLLWKNRDTGTRDNEIVRFAPREIDGKTTLAFVAVTNAGSTLPWGGLNEAGFAIINTLTKDMAGEGRGPGNGSFMREALRWCRTVEDFEAQLERTAGRRSTVATFSVIDANGRGVTFEVGPDRHVAFDAADPAVAGASCAAGVVVRSNFTYTAQGLAPGDRAGEIATKSYRRYARAGELLGGGDKIGLSYMFETVMRDQANQQPAEGTALIDTRETISRRTSVCGILIQGVRPGEDPRLSTMWVMLGEPTLGVAVPAWATMERTSEIVDGAKTSPLCDAAGALRDRLYTETDDGARLDRSRLPGVHEDTLLAEREIITQTAEALDRWRRQGVDPGAMQAAHQGACERALRVLEREVEQAAGP